MFPRSVYMFPERVGLDFDLLGCTSPSIPAVLAPPFPLVVVIILPATYCDPARFMSSTSSHAIVVVVVVRIIIVSVRVAVMIASVRYNQELPSLLECSQAREARR